MTEEEALKLLDEYYQLRSTGQLYAYVAHQACLDAMTQSADLVPREVATRTAELLIDHAELAARQNAETIAEQQREIERLRSAFDNYGLHLSRCQVWKNGDLSAVTKCTCGLDEVCNERA